MWRPAGRLRPVDLVRDAVSDGEAVPSMAVEAAVAVTEAGVRVESDFGRVLGVRWREGRLSLEIDGESVSSRRHGRPTGAVDRIGLSVTGDRIGGWARVDGEWRLCARLDERPGSRHDAEPPAWSILEVHGGDDARLGRFGQLGLRDLRLVTHVDGTPVWEGGHAVLSATSAGPGGFTTAHTSLWALDPDELTLEHRSDLFFSRIDRRTSRPAVLGDHACHVVRDGDTWLVAASTWADFDRRRGLGVTTTLSRTAADLTRGCHVLDSVPWDLPTDGLDSVGVWDPHLQRTATGWRVAFVSARRYFDFHPALAEGADLDSLHLRAAAPERTATEGVTLHRGRLLASDGPDNPRRLRRRYPVFDLDLVEQGTIDAPYPTNIPWPTLLDLPSGGQLMVGFDGTAGGGPLCGYGTHGDVVFARTDAEEGGDRV